MSFFSPNSWSGSRSVPATGAVSCSASLAPGCMLLLVPASGGPAVPPLTHRLPGQQRVEMQENQELETFSVSFSQVHFPHLVRLAAAMTYLECSAFFIHSDARFTSLLLFNSVLMLFIFLPFS